MSLHRIALFCALTAGLAPLAQAQPLPRSDTPQATERLRTRLAERVQERRAPLPPDVQKIADLPYGPDARQRMDIYRPSTSTPDPSGARAPVVFIVACMRRSCISDSVS